MKSRGSLAKSHFKSVGYSSEELAFQGNSMGEDPESGEVSGPWSSEQRARMARVQRGRGSKRYQSIADFIIRKMESSVC